MNNEEFKNEFVEALKENLSERGNDVDVKVSTVEKMNQSYEAITITPEGSNIGMNMNLEVFAEAYESGVPFNEIVEQVTNKVEAHLADMPTFDVQSLTDYEQMKDKLAMEVVAADRNADLLAKVPHQEMEDMAVVYRFVMESDENGRASILVSNDLLDKMGVTPEQLHADALENAPELRPAVIKGMSEVMMDMMGEDAHEMFGIEEFPQDEMMYVATVPDKISGAGVIAYQEFMDQAAEKLGGECIAIRWEDLDFENRMISVNHNLTDRPDSKGVCRKRIETPKTEAGTRMIPMIQEVFEAFLTEYEIQKCLGFCEEEIDGYSGFVFNTAYHTVYSASAVNNAIHRATKAYNNKEEMDAKKEDREPLLLPDFSAHHLRHTFCTRLCENETNLKVIMSIMGHADISTTMDIYAECTKEKKKEVMTNIEGCIIIK